VVPHALIPWLSPEMLIEGAGPWALVVVCAVIFAETGLLVGFLLPGDTLLIIAGLLTFPAIDATGVAHHLIRIDIWWVCLAIAFAAFLGGEVGYIIGHKLGPRVFERRESGLFSVENVKRTNAFFERFGALAVILARFVPIVRTFAPVAAGVGHMNYRKYSLYNAIGAAIWGAGLTLVGYVLGYIPVVADVVRSYIDLILIGAVVVTVIPTAIHYFTNARKAKKRAAEHSAVPAEADVVLDSAVFEQPQRRVED